jgi:hypothetical protein
MTNEMAAGNELLRAWVMEIPRGFENFFGRRAAKFRNGLAPDSDALQKLGQEFGIEFLRPPLAALTNG